MERESEQKCAWQQIVVLIIDCVYVNGAAAAMQMIPSLRGVIRVVKYNLKRRKNIVIRKSISSGTHSKQTFWLLITIRCFFVVEIKSPGIT